MLAIIAAILMDQAFAGVVVVLMQSGGEAIEDYGLRRASSSLDALLARAPRVARRKRVDASIETVNVSEVRIGDILVVRPGSLVPVDGEIILGKSEIDESALTGEPIPKAKSSGDKVLSGSVNLNGGLEMRADKPSSESEYAKIVQLVKRAQEEKPPIQRLADHYAVYFTPITLAVSAMGFLITLNPVTVLAVLVVADSVPPDTCNSNCSNKRCKSRSEARNNSQGWSRDRTDWSGEGCKLSTRLGRLPSDLLS